MQQLVFLVCSICLVYAYESQCYSQVSGCVKQLTRSAEHYEAAGDLAMQHQYVSLPVLELLHWHKPQHFPDPAPLPAPPLVADAWGGASFKLG